MRRLLGPGAFFLLAAVVLAGCQVPPPQNSFAEISFSHLKPIRLDVGGVAGV